MKIRITPLQMFMAFLLGLAFVVVSKNGNEGMASLFIAGILLYSTYYIGESQWGKEAKV